MDNNQSQYNQEVTVSEEKKKDTFGILSLCMGIASIVLSCCAMPPLPILAIVFAFLSKKRNENNKFSSLAMVGLIAGIVGVVLLVIATIVWYFVCLAGVLSDSLFYSLYY